MVKATLELRPKSYPAKLPKNSPARSKPAKPSSSQWSNAWPSSSRPSRSPSTPHGAARSKGRCPASVLGRGVRDQALPGVRGADRVREETQGRV